MAESYIENVIKIHIAALLMKIYICVCVCLLFLDYTELFGLGEIVACLILLKQIGQLRKLLVCKG